MTLLRYLAARYLGIGTRGPALDQPAGGWKSGDTIGWTLLELEEASDTPDRWMPSPQGELWTKTDAMVQLAQRKRAGITARLVRVVEP